MTKVVFFDTDVIISFLKINEEWCLFKLFNNEITIPEPVLQELYKRDDYRLKIDGYIRRKQIIVWNIEAFTTEQEYYDSFITPNKGVKAIGRGEAAALACAIVYNAAIASNNFKDVKYFVDKHNLDHYSTGRILKELIDLGELEMVYAEKMWGKMIKVGRMLPTKSFKEYMEKFKI